ncbi:MAG: hypothetical protein B6244_05135 [Candidatus Cloacimonetes bacterium 4572_55]|nr:MAG: hypothetical protein B6244_05135 [Candidatus Cloacimonetes bacterium 4572_55]
MSHAERLFVLAFILMISGCTGKVPQLTPITDVTAKSELTRSILDEQNKLVGLKASGRIQISYQGAFHNLKYAAAYKEPTYCRFDTYILFGKLASSLVLTPDSLLVHSPMTNEYLALPLEDGRIVMEQGPALPFDVNDMVNMLTGSFDLPDPESIQVAQSDKSYQLEWSQGNLHYLTAYDRKALYPKWFEARENDSPIARIEFLGYKRIEDMYRPRQVNMLRFNSNDKLTLFIKKQQINPEIELDTFRLNIPRGTQRLSPQPF